MPKSLKPLSPQPSVELETGEPQRPSTVSVYSEIIADKKNVLTEDQKRQEKVDEFVSWIRTHVAAIENAEDEQRTHEEEDARFDASDQWDADVKQARKAEKRPCLTINRLGAFRRQITNEQRQARPAITVFPLDGAASKDTAETLQSIIRLIEQESDADVVYDTACEHQTAIGRGYVLGMFSYDTTNGWDQVIRLKRCLDPSSVYVDQAAEEFDYSDARIGIIRTRMPKDDYIDMYGEASYDRCLTMFAENDPNHWMPEEDITVAVVYYLDVTHVDIILVEFPAEAGATGADNTPKHVKELIDSPEVRKVVADQDGVVIRRRRICHKTVRECTTNGVELLEGNADLTAGAEIPGDRIPIFPVIGEERHRKGKRDYRGITRDARDPQRMYNYSVSYEMEAIGLQPLDPFIAEQGQIEGLEMEWKSMNTQRRAVLRYKAKSVDGQLLPPPQRQSPSVDLSSIAMSVRQHDSDLKAVIGLFDASLGQSGPEQSGKAILARQRQGQIGSSHYMDNLARTIRSVGRWMMSAIPLVYEMPRVLQIVGLDEAAKKVLVHGGNVPQQGVPGGEMSPLTDDELKELHGVQEVYNLAQGRYGIGVTVGPSYASRRAEAVEALTAFIQAVPTAAPLIMDIVAEFSDWPGAQKIVKRLRKLNPQLEDEQPSDLPPEVLAQMQGMMQELQALKGALMEANETIRTKKMELESKEAIVAAQEQTKLAIQMAESNANAALLHMQEMFTSLREEIAEAKASKEQSAGPAGVPPLTPGSPTSPERVPA